MISREQSDQLWELARDMRGTARHLENTSVSDRAEYDAASLADRAALTAFIEALQAVSR